MTQGMIWNILGILWVTPWIQEFFFLHLSLLATLQNKQVNGFSLNCHGILWVTPWIQEFLAATKQLYKWYFPSVCPSVCLSVCLSVCHTFLTMFPSSYHHEIFRNYYQWQKWRPLKRSRSEVKGQGHRGHNPTLPFPDCNSSLNSHMMMKWCIQLDNA